MLTSSTIYSLKRAFGVQAIYNRPNIGPIDISAGTADVVVDTYNLFQVIVLPRSSKIIRRVLNQPFNFGAFVDKNERWLMIDPVDLPISPLKDDYLTIGNQRDIVVEIYTYDGAHVLKTRTDG